MDKIRQWVRLWIGVVAEILGFIVFAYVFAYGALRLYNDQRFGQEFRIMMTQAWQGSNIEYTPSEPRRRK